MITFESDEERPGAASVVTFLVESHSDIVRLTVTHENVPNTAMLEGISRGWPAVLASLKSMLETGDVLPAAPWGCRSCAHMSTVLFRAATDYVRDVTFGRAVDGSKTLGEDTNTVDGADAGRAPLLMRGSLPWQESLE